MIGTALTRRGSIIALAAGFSSVNHSNTQCLDDKTWFTVGGMAIGSVAGLAAGYFLNRAPENRGLLDLDLDLMNRGVASKLAKGTIGKAVHWIELNSRSLR